MSSPPVSSQACAGRRQVYDICSPGYRGRCTAPLLIDRRARRIISNESAGIVRNLNAVRLPGCSDVDLVPPGLAAEIDALNEQIYDKVPSAPATLLVYSHAHRHDATLSL